MTTRPQVSPQASPPPVARPRYAVVYRVAGDVRYLSHHDEMRMLNRALVRAGWPLAHSQGFNPQPRVKLPLPRRVGLAADDQVALVELEERQPPATLADALAATLPAGFTLVAVRGPVAPKTLHATGVTYTVPLSDEAARVATAHIPPLLAASAAHVSRPEGAAGVCRDVDVRPYIEALELDGGRLHMRLRVVSQQTARPEEILTKLELSPHDHLHRVSRSEVRWDIELPGG